LRHTVDATFHAITQEILNTLTGTCNAKFCVAQRSTKHPRIQTQITSKM